jgi:hypothetical protein
MARVYLYRNKSAVYGYEYIYAPKDAFLIQLLSCEDQIYFHTTAFEFYFLSSKLKKVFDEHDTTLRDTF